MKRAAEIRSLLAMVSVFFLMGTELKALVIHDGAGAVLGGSDAAMTSLVGQVGVGSGVYLGDGFVLTAAHVGAGDLLLGGVRLPVIPGTSEQLTNLDGSLIDLVLYRVNDGAAPDLGVALNEDPIAKGQQVLLVGFGVGQQSTPLVGFDGAEFGYHWNSEKALRSGVATVSRAEGDRITLGATSTPIFTTKFTSEGPSAQGTSGDSGGAAFVIDEVTGDYKLAGVMVGVTGQQGSSRFTSATYIADVSQISSLVGEGSLLPNSGAVPEPSTALYAVIALALALFRRRR